MATRTDKIRTVFEGVDDLTPVQKKAAKGFQDTGKEADNFGDKMKNTSLSLGGVVTALGGVVAALGVGVFAKSSIDAAIAAEEIQSKFNTVFTAVQDDADLTAKNLAKNYGLATSEAQNLLSATGDLLTGFGFSDDAALGLSNQVQELSVDLASFNNLQGGAKQASDIITKALLGERDALTTLGVKVMESDLQAKLAAEGKDKLTGSALLAAKAEATFALILEQTGKAQGDFARTSDSVANRQRVLGAAFEDLKVEIGNKLLPVWEGILTVLQNVLPIVGDVVEQVANFLTPVISEVSNVVRGFFGFLSSGSDDLDEFSAAVGGLIPPWVLNVVSIISDRIQKFGAFLGDAFAMIQESVAEAWPVIEPIFTRIGDAIGGIANTLIDIFVPILDFAFNQLFKPIVEWVATNAGPILIVIFEAVASALEFVGGVLRSVFEIAVPILQEIFRVAGEVFNGIKAIVEPVFTFIGNLFNSFAGFITGFVVPVIQLLWLGFQEGFSKIKEIVASVFNTLKPIIQPFIDFVMNNILPVVQQLWDGFTNAFTGIRDGASNIMGGIIDAVKNIINGFIDIINGFIRGVNDILSSVDDLSSVVGISVDFRIGEIGHLQTGTNFFPGGLAVMNEVGPEMAILPRGTRVRSYDGNGGEQVVGEGNGTTINNYNTFYERVDMNRVASKLAFQLE